MNTKDGYKITGPEDNCIVNDCKLHQYITLDTGEDYTICFTKTDIERMLKMFERMLKMFDKEE